MNSIDKENIRVYKVSQEIFKGRKVYYKGNLIKFHDCFLFEIGINQSRCSRHLIQTEALIESSEALFQKGNIKVLIHE